MIVFGGTLGAVMLQFPLPVVVHAFRRLRSVFFDSGNNPEATIRRLVKFAQKARREGIVSLDSDLPEIEDPFLRKSLTLAVDGTEPDELRKIMELELNNQAEYEEQVPAGLRVGWRVCSDHRHHRRRAWSHSGDATSRQNR